MMGAGPFSRARSSAASQPATAISRDTFCVNATDFFEPYFMHSMVMVEPRPRKPMPWRRLRMISSRCCAKRQAVDLDHVVEHAREDLHDLAIGLPIEARIVGERIDHELGEIHRARAGTNHTAGAVVRHIVPVTRPLKISCVAIGLAWYRKRLRVRRRSIEADRGSRIFRVLRERLAFGPVVDTWHSFHRSGNRFRAMKRSRDSPSMMSS